MILTNLVAVNGFIGMITFKPKFMEQTYGQSASRAIFLIGMEHSPPFPTPKTPSELAETMILLQERVIVCDKSDWTY